MTSAQGEDRSGFQPIAGWPGLQFGFAKATNGLGAADPTFASNWALLASEGLHRGAYHELTGSGSTADQAAFFVTTVKEQGLRPGDMLAVSVSDYPGIDGPMIRDFLAEAAHLAGPNTPLIIYTDLSFGSTLSDCTGYPLWIAWPNSEPPPSVAPWPSWRFWQWSFGGGEVGSDQDAFNGTPAELDAWIASYLPKPPTPVTIPTGDDDMLIQLTTTGQRTGPIPVWADASAAHESGGFDAATFTISGDAGTAVTLTAYWDNGNRNTYPLECKVNGQVNLGNPPAGVALLHSIDVKRTDEVDGGLVNVVVSRWESPS